MTDFNDWFFENDMRDENEKRILKAIRENDVAALKKILKNPVNCRLGSVDMPILSVAVFKGDSAVIKHLIDSGCDLRRVDKNGRSAFHVLFWRPLESFDDQKLQLDIADILLNKCSNTIEAVFLTANKHKMTPFLYACLVGFNEMILRFLALIDDSNSIPMDYVIDRDGDNMFHHLFNGSNDFLPPIRREIVQALLDKFPYSDQLIDAKNVDGETPLQKLMTGDRNVSREMIDLANLFFQHGASPDTRNKNGTTYLERAVRMGNVSLVEMLLRVGCRLDKFKNGMPLPCLLGRRSDSSSIRIIELLLAFGYDLQKELFLVEFASAEYANRRDTSGMDAEVLEALKELRRSNKMLSLQRQCRNTIRRHLKAKADHVISNLTCIPDRIKSFLLVQNEAPLLSI